MGILGRWIFSLEVRSMKTYLVSLHEEKGDKFVMHFECEADDADHAEEQALNAYPLGEVINIMEEAA